MESKEKSLGDGNKLLSWKALGLMTFTSVWGFGNIVNGYANQGLKAVVSWILMFTLYFIPYVLMVGEWALPLRTAKGAFRPGSVPQRAQNWPILLAGPTGLSTCHIWHKNRRIFSSRSGGRFWAMAPWPK